MAASRFPPEAEAVAPSVPAVAPVIELSFQRSQPQLFHGLFLVTTLVPNEFRSFTALDIFYIPTLLSD